MAGPSPSVTLSAAPERSSLRPSCENLSAATLTTVWLRCASAEAWAPREFSSASRRWGTALEKSFQHRGHREHREPRRNRSFPFRRLFLSFSTKPSVLSVAFLRVLCVKFRKLQRGAAHTLPE